MKCCGGVYNGHKGCVSDHFTKDKSKDGKVIFQNILTGRYYCATCLFQEPEFDGFPDCKGSKQTVYKYTKSHPLYTSRGSR